MKRTSSIYKALAKKRPDLFNKLTSLHLSWKDDKKMVSNRAFDRTVNSVIHSIEKLERGELKKLGKL